jgi:hypothetical protein
VVANVWEQDSLDSPVEQRVSGLNRCHGCDRAQTLELSYADVRGADRPNEPRSPEIVEGLPGELELMVGNRPMQLVQIDRFDTQPAKARLNLAPQ